MRSNTDTGSVAWIGVGNLASPIVNRLIDAGIRPLLHDVRADALIPFSGRADIADTIGDAVAQADLVFSTIPDDRALTSVASSVAGALRPHGIYCDMSTVSPEASAAVAALFAEKGHAYLRAPVSGTVGHAREGVLTIIASGPGAAYARCLPVFEHFAARCFHVGPAEEARTLKLLINNLVGSTVALLAESLALGSKAGIDWTTMLDVISASAIASPLLKLKADALKTRDFTAAFTTDLMIKDIGLFAAAAAELGCPVPLAEQTLALLREHADAGGGSEDYVGLVKLFETKSGL